MNAELQDVKFRLTDLTGVDGLRAQRLSGLETTKTWNFINFADAR